MSQTRPLTGFLSAPVHHDVATLEASFAFLGIPYGSPCEMHDLSADATNAPAAIREVDRRQSLTADYEYYDFDLGGPLFPTADVRLVDCGDVQGVPWDLEGNKRRATETIRTILRRGAIPLVMGGDCSIPPLVIRAFEGSGRLDILHIDAHLDFRDELMGVRDGYASPIRRIRDMAWVEHIVQVGLRGSGSSRPADVKEALDSGNVLITAREVHENSIGCVIEQLRTPGPWFISIDCDGLDPTIAPGTGYPLPGGLTFGQVSALIRELTSRSTVAGIAFTEHYPSLDVRSLTGLTIIRLLMIFMGLVARSGRVHVIPEENLPGSAPCPTSRAEMRREYGARPGPPHATIVTIGHHTAAALIATIHLFCGGITVQPPPTG